MATVYCKNRLTDQLKQKIFQQLCNATRALSLITSALVSTICNLPHSRLLPRWVHWNAIVVALCVYGGHKSRFVEYTGRRLYGSNRLYGSWYLVMQYMVHGCADILVGFRVQFDWCDQFELCWQCGTSVRAQCYKCLTSETNVEPVWAVCEQCVRGHSVTSVWPVRPVWNQCVSSVGPVCQRAQWQLAANMILSPPMHLAVISRKTWKTLQAKHFRCTHGRCCQDFDEVKMSCALMHMVHIWNKLKRLWAQTHEDLEDILQKPWKPGRGGFRCTRLRLHLENLQKF